MVRITSKKRKIIILFAAIIAVSALALAFTIVLSKKNNGVVIAKVNGVKIYQNELEDKLNEVIGSGQNDGNVQINNLPPEAVKILIKEIYLEREINKRVRKAKISGDKEVRRKVESYKNILLRQAFLDNLIEKNVTEKQIREKYMQFIANLAGKKEYQLSMILVRSQSDANYIFNRLARNNTDKYFTSLARKHSIDRESSRNGGDLGYILEDIMNPAISEHVIEARKGENLRPIKDGPNWKIIRVVDIRDAEVIEYEEIREEFKNQLQKEVIDKLYFGIVKDAQVDVLIDFAPVNEN